MAGERRWSVWCVILAVTAAVCTIFGAAYWHHYDCQLSELECICSCDGDTATLQVKSRDDTELENGHNH